MPVTKVLSSEARKTAALAISSGVPNRPIGTRFTMLSSICLPTGPDCARRSYAGVLIGPGLTAFTRIFRSFKSIVHVRANDRTAALVALYTLDEGLPLDATIEALRMIDPPSGISGRAF